MNARRTGIGAAVADAVLAEAVRDGIPPPADDAFRVRLEQVATVAAPRSVAIGWATVDLDRAEIELAERLAHHGRPVVRAATADDALGAKCRLLAFGPGPGVPLPAPSTAGRLAAALARFGEAALALYLVVDTGMIDAVRREGVVLSAPGDGPLGRQRLVLGGSRWGPHLLLVAEVRNRSATGPQAEPVRRTPAGTIT